MVPDPEATRHPADAGPHAPRLLFPSRLPAEPLPPIGTRSRLLLGLFLLAGTALAGAAVLTRAPDHPRPVVSAAPISGALAFRPDLVRDAHWPFKANGGFANTDAPPSSPTDPPLTDEHIANPAAGSANTAVQVVRMFYSQLPQNPAGAVDLLDPGLLGGRRDEIVAAWSAPVTVRLLHAETVGTSIVTAAVETTYRNGDRVVLNQKLQVATGTVPRIIGAELTSARHLPPT